MITNYTLWRRGKFASSVKRSLSYGSGVSIYKSSSKKQIWQLHLALLFILFFTQSIIAQTNYYSKATATDFNDVNSWGTATDGTGTSPASISNADNFFVANASVLSLSGNASVRQLTINAGSLTIAANSLTVSTATGNNSTFSINGGTLNMNGGSLIVNGNVSVVTGVFNQSGGNIIIDPNSGVVGTSVASGTTTLLFSVATGTVSGGTITIVDPNFNSNGKAVDFNTPAGANSTWSINHTLRIGDGVSIDPSSNTSGFILESYTGSGKLVYGNLIINGGAVTNRHASLGAWSIFVGGDLTVNSGCELRINSGSTGAVFSRNIINNGIITSTVPVIFAATLGTTTIPNTIAQVVSGSGVFRNLTASPTANFSSITINNTNINGVTFPGTTNIATQPTNSFSLSGTLTFTAGKINTVTGVPFILGASATTSGTLSYTAGGFVSGVTFGRWFGATATGTAITASTDATSVTSRYPFVGLNNANRSAWIERVTPAAAGGILGVTYTNIDGYTTVALTDGATALDTKANDSWAVSSLSGTPTAAASFKLNIVAPTIFGGTLNTAGVRVVKSDNTFVGAHQAGTVTPGGQRITILPADLISGSFTLATNASDVPYVSVATGNWNSPATWNKGTVPTCNDAVSIAASTTVTVNSSGNVAKNITINSGGTLVQASGDLTVDACTSINNNFVNNNGTLTVTGGALTVNGNLNNVTGSTFNQSGGDINVDGNKGAVTASSVASGTHLVLIATDNVSLTGGTLTVVDPHAASSTSSFAFSYTGTAAVNNTVGWTLKFGNGTSIDAGGTTGTASAVGGFIWNNTGGKIYYDNVIIDGGAGTNRNVYNTSNTIGINNLTINANGELVMATSGISIGGNFVNNGTFTHTAATLALQNFQSATASASTNPQAISGTGVFRNNLVTASSTASLNSILFNNTNATGITLNVPLSVGGTLTMTSGLINTTNTNLLRLGTATAAGVFSGTPSATNMVKGPFARTIVSGNANTNYILFPVGKSAYTPIWLAPTTTAVSVMKAEAFDSNTGTFDASLINMSTGRRWEAPLVSGTITNLNVRLGDAAIVSTNIPVQAPAASGIYTNAFGSVATFVAGTPNTIQSGTVILPANYTGFLSYADSNACSGTPVPGNTIASATTICSGNTVSLSLQNTIPGSGVTYVWESSSDGIAYTPISGATSSTYIATPTASTYYRVQATCSGNTGISTPVQVVFTNSITATTPGTRCGAGTVALSATPSTGASVSWYAAQTGGFALTTGNSFTTPSLAATTTYYASAEIASPVNAVLGAGATNSSSVAQSFFPGNWGGAKTQYIIRASELIGAGLSGSINLTSLGFEPTNSGQTYQGFSVSLGNTTAATAPTTTFISSGLTQVYAGTATNAGFTPVANTVNTLTFGTGSGSAPAFIWDGTSNIVVSISWSRVPSASTSTSSTMKVDNVGFVASAYRQRDDLTPAAMLAETSVNSTDSFRPRFTINGQSICSSPRVAVVATVTTPPTFTLSGNPVAVCQGQSTAPVTITAGASDYDTYVWSPSTGVSGDAVTGWIFNPSVTTTYTLTASQSSGSQCITSASVTITINPLPSPIVVTSPVSTCVDTVLALSSTGGALENISILAENFNGATNSWTTVNNSTGGTPASSAWTLRADNYSYGSVVFHSNDNSQFYLSNSDAAGTGSVASTLLQSPAFSTVGYSSVNLRFFSFLYDPSTTANTVGKVQASLDGVAWTDLQTLTPVTTNTTTTFAQTNVLLTPAYLNQPTVYIRFNYSAGWRYYWGIDNVSVVGSQNGTVVWSPTTNLYSDSAATTAYTGQNLSTVYLKSSTAFGPTTYTVTSTGSNSCSVSANVNVTVNATAAPIVADQTFCNSATVANLVATGTDIKWYAGSTGGSQLLGTDALTSTTYFASQTLNGCESPRVAVAVTISTTTAPTGTVAQSFCSTSNPTVADLVATGTAIQWYSNPTGGSPLASTVALTDGGMYYASQTVATCESATRFQVTATVNNSVCPNIEYANLQFPGSATIVTGGSIDVYAQVYKAGVTDPAGQGANITAWIGYSTTNTDPSTWTNWVPATYNASATGIGNNDEYMLLGFGSTLPVGTYYYASRFQYNGAPFVYGGYASTGGGFWNGTANISGVLTINCSVAAPTGDATQYGTTLADLVVSPTTGITWYGSEADALASTNELPLTTALVDGATYYATQTTTCESVPFAVTIDFDLKTPSFNMNNLKYYPNPVSNVLTVAYSEAITGLKLYNMVGQQLMSKSVNSNETQLDMSHLPAGSYLLEITAGTKSKMVKLLKNQ